MSRLPKLIEEGQRLLAEAKAEVKSVEIVHHANDPENPLTHKTHVRYKHGKNVHHYAIHTMEHPTEDGSHTVHKTTPDGEPLTNGEGQHEDPLHIQQVLKKHFKKHGGHTLHRQLVKNFTDRFHPAEHNRKD